MEMLHGLSLEQRTARKILLLEDCQSEVLVLTSSRLSDTWSPALREALAGCARRGLRVRLLLDSGSAAAREAAVRMRSIGLEVREAPKRLSLVLRPFPVHSEVWVFDRATAVTVNERLAATPEPERREGALRVECLFGTETARGIASYLDRRWEIEGRSLAFSVRHKSFSFHGGDRAELSFYACLLGAQKCITLSIPGGRVSRRVAAALHVALREGIRVQLYTNADRDDAPGLRRLRRLSSSGAVVKICGRRLRSEGAVIDGQDVYLGSLPASWHRWTRGSCPVFVVNDGRAAQELLGALEAQVSVEVSGLASTLAFR
jgi:hypothetical protein